MTIPFLSYLKKVKDHAVARKERPVEAPDSVTPLDKPSSERFSKTVMPNATRTLLPNERLDASADSPATGGQTSGSAGAPSLPAAPRTISFGGPTAAPARPRDLPPAVALALEPRVERVISLELADIAGQIPADYIKPLESIDGTRRILLKASEVEKGMASGKPTVSLAMIYQQVPEIFLRTIAPVDDAQVPLPFKKVLDQFTSLQVRTDQEKHLAVPQVETPFLQATLEDNSKFGTTTEVGVEVGDLPPVRIELATAQAYAAAEPEANGFVRQPASEGTSASPTRIPLNLSPNGTGGPASESVPASSGPSVPNTLPEGSSPTRIPFKMTVPSNGECPADEPWLTAASLAAPSEQPVASEPAPAKETAGEVKIALALKPILQALPPFQLSGDPNTLPAGTLIELPFSLIEPQLATGRIALSPAIFEAALPTEYRDLFKRGDQPADVLLPLQDVLKNLPAASLQRRQDQEELEAGTGYVTPFSAKADEDAKRFGTPATVAASPAITPAKADYDTQPDAAPAKIPFELKSSAPVEPAVETDKAMDAKSAVVELNKLSGVKACALMFGDGLSLAGNLPPEYETDGLCAMGPSLMQRIKSHMVETKLGALESMTLSCTEGAISFFVRENLCLAAFHGSGELTAEVRKELAQAVHDLSRKYSHPV